MFANDLDYFEMKDRIHIDEVQEAVAFIEELLENPKYAFREFDNMLNDFIQLREKMLDFNITCLINDDYMVAYAEEVLSDMGFDDLPDLIRKNVDMDNVISTIKEECVRISFRYKNFYSEY